MNSLGTSSMMLRNVNTGALDIYDVSNNQLTNDTELGADYSGLDWQIGGFADGDADSDGVDRQHRCERFEADRDGDFHLQRGAELVHAWPTPAP